MAEGFRAFACPGSMEVLRSLQLLKPQTLNPILNPKTLNGRNPRPLHLYTLNPKTRLALASTWPPPA